MTVPVAGVGEISSIETGACCAIWSERLDRPCTGALRVYEADVRASWTSAVFWAHTTACRWRERPDVKCTLVSGCPRACALTWLRAFWSGLRG